MNSQLLQSHNKTVRVAGKTFRIIALTFAGKMLVDADPLDGGKNIPLVNPKFKTKGHVNRNSVSTEILHSIEQGLVS